MLVYVILPIGGKMKTSLKELETFLSIPENRKDRELSIRPYKLYNVIYTQRVHNERFGDDIKLESWYNTSENTENKVLKKIACNEAITTEKYRRLARVCSVLKIADRGPDCEILTEFSEIDSKYVLHVFNELTEREKKFVSKIYEKSYNGKKKDHCCFGFSNEDLEKKYYRLLTLLEEEERAMEKRMVKVYFPDYTPDDYESKLHQIHRIQRIDDDWEPFSIKILSERVEELINELENNRRVEKIYEIDMKSGTLFIEGNKINIYLKNRESETIEEIGADISSIDDFLHDATEFLKFAKLLKRN